MSTQEVTGLTDQPRNLVAEFMRQLEAKVGSDFFELWFSAPGSVLMEEGKLIVCASDDFSMDRIKASYHSVIQSLAAQIGLPPVVFEIRDHCDALVPSGNLSSQETGSVLDDSGSSSGNDRPGDCSEHALAEPRNSDRLEKAATADQTLTTPDGLTDSVSAKSGPKLRFSLRDFIFDPANEMLYKACGQVIREPGELSPFFVHGPSGCGKTHLLEGIAAEVKRRSRTGKVQLVSAEQFTSDYVGSLRNRTMPLFRRRYRELEYLLVDDLQFFAGKKSTLQELQQTIEVVTRKGGQVIVSADRSPQELDFAGQDFVNRVACGLTTQIQPPSRNSKVRIVERLAAKRNVVLEKATVHLIAEKISGDIRLISGALNRLRLFQLIESKPIDPSIARKHLGDLFQISRRTVSISEIEKAVCDVFGLDQKCLRSASKVKAISQPRMLAMWLSRKYTRAALSEIGEYFGGRSHSTVISAQSKVNQWVEKSELIGLKYSQFPVENAIRRVEQELQVG